MDCLEEARRQRDKILIDLIGINRVRGTMGLTEDIREMKNAMPEALRAEEPCKRCGRTDDEAWWKCCPAHCPEHTNYRMCTVCTVILHPSFFPVDDKGDGNYIIDRPVGGPDIRDIMSPDAEVVYNDQGAGQSSLPTRFDLFDAKAMFATAIVLHEGAEKYAPGNWRGISTRDHLNHLLAHIYAYLDGDRSDAHLEHAVCRAMFALGRELDPEATEEKDQTLT